MQYLNTFHFNIANPIDFQPIIVQMAVLTWFNWDKDMY